METTSASLWWWCRFVACLLLSCYAMKRIASRRHGNLDFMFYVGKTLVQEFVGYETLPTSKAGLQQRIDTSSKSAPSISTIPVSASFPKESTEAEQRRFLKARDGNVQAANEMLQNYLDWRKKYHDGKSTTDASENWSRACRSASAPTSLPCIVFMLKDNLTTVNGKRIVQHLPARIDLTLADGETYATALALYIDYTLSRESMKKMCVVIDVRPGKGWPNISALNLVPFIKHAAKLLNELHPERLEKCILFPVPHVAVWIYNMVKPFLDPDTASKISIISGWANSGSPVPKGITKHVEADAAEWMEQNRLSYFTK